jgi:hypothetical protein
MTEVLSPQFAQEFKNTYRALLQEWRRDAIEVHVPEAWLDGRKSGNDILAELNPAYSFYSTKDSIKIVVNYFVPKTPGSNICDAPRQIVWERKGE